MIEDSYKIRAELLLYLAGELSPEARDSFDQRLLADDDFARSIDDAEEDLIEDYAAGTLTADELPVVRPWVEVSAQRRSRVALIVALRRDRSVAPTVLRSRAPWTRQRWVWLLPVAAAVALLAVLPLLHRERTKPSVPDTVLQARVEPLPVLRAAATDTILLDTHRFRGSSLSLPDGPRFVLHAGATTRIQILLPSGSTGPYTVDLRLEAAGKQVPIHAVDLKPIALASRAYVELSLPSGTLHPGRYSGDLRSATASYPLHFLAIDK